MYKNFKVRSSAQVSKFNPLGSSVALSEATAALILLGNADVNSAQRISILAAASHNNITLSTNASVHEFVRSVRYEKIASVACQSAHPRNSDFRHGCANASNNASALNANAAHASTLNLIRSASKSGSFSLPQDPRSTLRMSSKEVQPAKRNRICSRRGKYGHWYADGYNNGSLKDNILAENKPVTNARSSNHGSRPASANSTISFNCAEPRCSTPLENPPISAAMVLCFLLASLKVFSLYSQLATAVAKKLKIAYRRKKIQAR